MFLLILRHLEATQMLCPLTPALVFWKAGRSFIQS